MTVLSNYWMRCILSILSFIILHVNAQNEDCTNNNSKTCTKKMQCPLYLAESSIPGAGMGLYTGKDIPLGQTIGNPDVVIPLFDMENTIKHMVKSYSWQGYMHGINQESNIVEALSPGIFAIVNGHQGLANVHIMPSTTYDGLNMHRSKDLGVGAYTPYSNVMAYVSNGKNLILQSGSELFADYGDQWYTFEERKDKFKAVPLKDDYVNADAVIETFAPFLLKHWRDIPLEYMQKFWDFMKTVIPKKTDDDEDDDEEEDEEKRETAFDLIPTSVLDVLKVLKAGGSAFYNAPENFIRSSEWLETNGLCIGYLTLGPSTIKQAGRGAFTTRPFSTGSIVTSTPLFHECYMHEYLDYEVNNDPNNKRKQLLLNYCFQHPKSTLSLCPYGSQTSLINHNKSPNVKIQWSTSSYHNKTWTDEFTLEELCSQKHAQLVIDYIALKDIEEGDEIFIDYGDEWESAWNEYTTQWNTKELDKEYKSAYDYNKSENIIKTQVNDNYQYPSNILTECFFAYTDGAIEANTKTQLFDITNKLHKIYPFTTYKKSFVQLHKCRVYERTGNTYSVGMRLFYDEDEEQHESIVYGVPRDAIRFVDGRYSSDLHLEYAFRYPIGFDDELFPDQWKNL